LEWTNQRDAPRTARTRTIAAVCRHDDLPQQPPATSRIEPVVRCGPLHGIVSGAAGAGQEARHRASPFTARRLLGEMQFQRADAASGVQSNLPLNRERLQGDRAVRAADQRVGANAGDGCRLRRGANIGSS
jgi:hypothetical protein